MGRKIVTYRGAEYAVAQIILLGWYTALLYLETTRAQRRSFVGKPAAETPKPGIWVECTDLDTHADPQFWANLARNLKSVDAQSTAVHDLTPYPYIPRLWDNDARDVSVLAYDARNGVQESSYKITSGGKTGNIGSVLVGEPHTIWLDHSRRQLPQTKPSYGCVIEHPDLVESEVGVTLSNDGDHVYLDRNANSFVKMVDVRRATALKPYVGGTALNKATLSRNDFVFVEVLDRCVRVLHNDGVNVEVDTPVIDGAGRVSSLSSNMTTSVPLDEVVGISMAVTHEEGEFEIADNPLKGCLVQNDKRVLRIYDHVVDGDGALWFNAKPPRELRQPPKWVSHADVTAYDPVMEIDQENPYPVIWMEDPSATQRLLGYVPGFSEPVVVIPHSMIIKATSVNWLSNPDIMRRIEESLDRAGVKFTRRLERVFEDTKRSVEEIWDEDEELFKLRARNRKLFE